MARRRANGEGTIVRRSDGRFHAAYYVLAPDGTGVDASSTAGAGTNVTPS